MTAAPVAPPHPKLIYCAERHSSFDPAGFTRRWRQHARLGMSLPRWANIQRYVHCDPLDLAVPGARRQPCDGIAMVWYRSEATRQRHIADPEGRAIMKQDEAETFGRPVRECSFLARELIVAPTAAGAFRLFRFIGRRAGLSRPEFRAAWQDRHGAAVANRLRAAPMPVNYVQNHAASDDERDDLGLGGDCIEEFAIADPRRLDDALLDIPADLADRVTSIWTREAVLYQAQVGAPAYA